MNAMFHCIKRLCPALACAVVAVCASCNGANAPDRAALDAIPALVVGVGRDFYEGPASETYIHGSTCVWESLTRLDTNMRPVPGLAESWSVRDGGKVWTFTLRSGVRYHNGSVLCSRDVVDNFMRRKNHPRFDSRGICREIESVRCNGGRKVVFALKKPIPFFASMLAYYGSPILHPSAFGGDGSIKNAIGTGPFKIDRIIPGRGIEISAFDAYRGDAPAYKKIYFRNIPDAQTRVYALLKGEIDAIIDLGGILPEQVNELKSCPDIIIQKQGLATTHYLFFNCRRFPFSDVRARLWLARRIDSERIVRLLNNGAGIPARTPYTPLAAQWVCDEYTPCGVPDHGAFPLRDRPLILLLHSGVLQRLPYVQIAEVVEHIFRNGGVPVRILVKEAGAYRELLKRGDFDMSIQPRNLQTGDPDFFYSNTMAGDGIQNMGYMNAQVDALIGRAKYEMDINRRKSLYCALSAIVWRDMPFIPLYHDEAFFSYRNTVCDLGMDASFRPGLTRVKPARIDGLMRAAKQMQRMIPPGNARQSAMKSAGGYPTGFFRR